MINLGIVTISAIMAGAPTAAYPPPQAEIRIADFLPTTTIVLPGSLAMRAPPHAGMITVESVTPHYDLDVVWALLWPSIAPTMQTGREANWSERPSVMSLVPGIVRVGAVTVVLIGLAGLLVVGGRRRG